MRVVTQYIAEDDKVFDSQYECELYEIGLTVAAKEENERNEPLEELYLTLVEVFDMHCEMEYANDPISGDEIEVAVMPAGLTRAFLMHRSYLESLFQRFDDAYEDSQKGSKTKTKRKGK